MSTEQVTLRELVKDDIYRQWIRTPPVGGFPIYTKFRVYAQVDEGGAWAKRDFDTFKAAYAFLARNLGKWYDAALVCRNYECRPPVVRFKGKRQYYAPVLTFTGHEWCPYCRRPTVFGLFKRHHAFRGTTGPKADVLRCGICGIAETAIKHYKAQGEIQ